MRGGVGAAALGGHISSVVFNLLTADREQARRIELRVQKRELCGETSNQPRSVDCSV